MRPPSTVLPIVALATALVLAGCLSGDETPTATRAPEKLSQGVEATGLAGTVEDLSRLAAADPANATADAPAWAVGDAWTLTTSSADASPEQVTLVVTSAGGATYRLDATGESLASYDALFDVSYVGPIRVADLAGSQEGTAVKFFDFPLRDGKTWTTTWDGLEVQVTATLNPAISTAMGTQPGFDVVARAGDAVHATYDYVPALKWWSHVEFSEGYGMRVERFAPNWTGEVVRAEARPLLEVGSAGPVARGPGGAFTVAEGSASVALVMMGFSQHQARAIVIVDGAGNPVGLEGGDDVLVEPNPRSEFRVQFMPATPGEWHVGALIAHDPGAWYSLAFHEIVTTPVAVA